MGCKTVYSDSQYYPYTDSQLYIHTHKCVAAKKQMLGVKTFLGKFLCWHLFIYEMFLLEVWKEKNYLVIRTELKKSAVQLSLDSLSGQVPFQSHLPNGWGIREVICHQNQWKSKLIFERYLSQGQDGIQVFSSPENNSSLK